jgi:hypothetical protein
MRIPKPEMKASPDAKAHPFPFQIGLQTQEFIQAALFLAVIADIAAGEYLKLPGSITHLEKRLVDAGLDKAVINEGWKYIQKYSSVFEGTVYQNALITFNSHWDWYVRNLHAFVKVASIKVTSPQLTRSQAKDFNRLSFMSIPQQIKILETVCGVQFCLSQEAIGHLKEMSLVRNLGLHNRWEIDEKYLRNTETGPWSLGDLRIVRIEELRNWHTSLLQVILSSSSAVAIEYKDAPEY